MEVNTEWVLIKLTWCHVNGSGEHRDEGVQRVLVESMDLVQAVQQEEEHGSSSSHSPVLQRMRKI